MRVAVRFLYCGTLEHTLTANKIWLLFTARNGVL